MSFFALVIITTTFAQEKKYSFSASKMGSPFNIIFFAADSVKAAVLASECFALVDSFNTVFSDYDSKSELNALNATAGTGLPAHVSPALWDIIMQSRKAYTASDGSFDITVGPLTMLWRNARKTRMFPAADIVAKNRALTGFYRLQFTDERPEMCGLPLTGMRLDLGGIAKGYAAQKVVDHLLSRGITRALADAGGDMAVSNAPPGTHGWVVGVNVPETTDELIPQRLLLQNKAVATSGDAYQYFAHDGKKYSHIIDPRTGYGITSQRNVTVIAANGTQADWLATACSILPVKTAKKLAVMNGAELLITELIKGRVIYYSTPGFARYWQH